MTAPVPVAVLPAPNPACAECGVYLNPGANLVERALPRGYFEFRHPATGVNSRFCPNSNAVFKWPLTLLVGEMEK